MPGEDRTGPMGMGPMTGRGAGYCGGRGVPGGTNRSFRGGRAGRGGRGHRHMFHATGLTGWQRATMDMPTAAPTAEAEGRSPQDEIETLRSQLDELKKRLAELETAKTQE
jgi:hypothetical protein